LFVFELFKDTNSKLTQLFLAMNLTRKCKLLLFMHLPLTKNNVFTKINILLDMKTSKLLKMRSNTYPAARHRMLYELPVWVLILCVIIFL